MQYTAKKPYTSVLLIKPDGLRCRLQEDHLFKDIRYAQVTKVKVKKDYFRLYFRFLLSPFMIMGQIFIIRDEGLNVIYGINLLFWCCFLGFYFLVKPTYIITIDKGPLTAEVFSTHKLKEAKQIKKDIEAHL